MQNMSCGTCSSEEACECDFIQDSKQKKGKGKAESLSVKQCPKSYIHVFTERVAVQKEIKEIFHITCHIILKQEWPSFSLLAFLQLETLVSQPRTHRLFVALHFRELEHDIVTTLILFFH